MAFALQQTKDILNKLCISPNRKLGQNFLVEPTIVQKSLDFARIKPNDVVIEIGPGCGTLTDSLFQAGAKVFAIEKDRGLHQHIVETFPIDIVHGDALDFPVGNFDLTTPYKIVANLPYAVASVWLDKILELPKLPECMVLLVQKEAADRWFASHSTKHFCALGINLQAAYNLIEKYCVAKRYFYPQPRVDSSLILLEKKQDAFIFSKSLKQFIRGAFIHRRQQIGRYCRESQASFSKDFLDYLDKNNFKDTLRAEEIPLLVWVNFARINMHFAKI